MTATIRPRVEGDIAPLADVLIQVHATDGYPVEGVDNPMDWLRTDGMLGAWVSEVEGRPVGQVMLASASDGDAAPAMLVERSSVALEDIAVLCRLFVSPDARGQGLAGLLIDTACAAALRKGRQLVLDVMKKDMAAIRAYRRAGWVELGSFEHQHAGGSEPALAFVYPGQNGVG